MEAQLSLTVAGERTTYPRAGPIQLTATLRNLGDAAVVVNGRMGVGYADNPVRELYFTVFSVEGEALPVPDNARADVHRLPPQADDFRTLGPGQAVTAAVELTLWYPFPRPGRYTVVFTYENSWDGAAFGLSAWVGSVDAEPVLLVVD